MAGTTELLADYDASELRFFRDEDAGLRGIIAIHDTRLGPAGGGTRRFAYDSESAAIEDVLQLARAMTYKYALAGINMGGAKAVIWVDDKNQRSEELYRSYGRVVDGFDGRFITGSDVGTDKQCLRWMNMETEFVTGLPEQFSKQPQEFFHAGGLGVMKAIKGCCELVYGDTSLKEHHVVVQGIGEMGENVVRYLVDNGAEVTIADVSAERVDAIEDELGVNTTDPSSVHSIPCDIFVPAALGEVLNDETVPELQCEIVCGPANNQLKDEERHAQLLEKRGILHAPDIVASSGTIIEHTDLLRQGGYKHRRVLAYLDNIREEMVRIGRTATETGTPPQTVARQFAEDRIERMAGIRTLRTKSAPPEW